ncbi:Crp/Fnr family transcriptional regulator [Puia dinghuensis]|uniref:Crp/Fnr family transcriptional regulator n=1 Tax=Puia dinghuensis TaxID=1792502 RepID=A0A8J2UDK1_9BACT|nr:Crp/Fnr family transcriptional regulator [Puia dinghuensis]GGB02754.1 Crp/Fnr family transcriptional regulator [Puia dinghuensis]
MKTEINLPETIKRLFPEFDPSLAEEVMAKGQVKSIREGEEIMRPGQHIKSTMLVLDGLIKIFREDEEGKEIFLYHLEPGQACALSILCCAQHRASEVKAVAVKDTLVLSIPIAQAGNWMRTNAYWYQFVLSTYRSRMEDLLNTIDAIAFRNMDERILLYLKKHRQMLNSTIIPVTHGKLATELGTSREVITRLLRKLAEQGYVKVNRQHIELLHPDNLPL